jgi:hypothetical protein
MKLKLDITPDLVAAMAAEVKAGEKAVTAAMREAGHRAQDRLARPDHRRGARPAARELDPEPDLPEGRREPERRGAGLVQGARHRRRPRHRPADPLEGWVLAGDPDRGCRPRPARRQDHPRRMGTPPRPAPALRLPPPRPEPAGRRGPDQQPAAQAWRHARRPAAGQVTVPIFLLVPQVKLPKRLDLDRDAERALDSVPGLIVANWVEERLG